MAAQMIRETISTNKVVIFSKTHCPYCIMVKEQFNLLSQPYRAIELDEHPDGADIQAALGKITGATTVPRVFINGKFVGGCNDVRSLNESGELKKLVV